MQKLSFFRKAVLSRIYLNWSKVNVLGRSSIDIIYGTDNWSIDTAL